MSINRPVMREALAVARRHASPRRIATLTGFGLGLLLVRGIVALAQAIDDLLWPEIRRQRVVQPVFLCANARSGTTFLHRLLSLDDEHFASFKLYQSIFPAVCIQRTVDGLARLDRRRLGGALQRAVRWFNATCFRSWDDIHEMGIDRAEEDEAFFALSFNSPALSLLLPWVDELPASRWFDRFEPLQRERFLDWYEGGLRRRLYAAGGDRTFLNKSALFASRIRSIYARFPDAHFVYLIRHPYESIPSFLNMFHAKWATHSPEIAKDSPESRALARLAMDYLRYALHCREFIPAEQFLVIRYEELTGEPRATVEQIYTWLGVEIDDRCRQALEADLATQSDFESQHAYQLAEFGLSRAEIYAELKDVFEEFGFEA